MKKIMSQEENGSFLFGLDLRERKARRSLSAKLNDNNTSYFRITWATSSTLLFTFFWRPFACLVSLSSLFLFLIRDLTETRTVPSVPSVFVVCQILSHALYSLWCRVISLKVFLTDVFISKITLFKCSFNGKYCIDDRPLKMYRWSMNISMNTRKYRFSSQLKNSESSGS